MDHHGPAWARLLATSRTAVLATIDPGGRARLVPVCFVALRREPDRVALDPAQPEPDWPVLYTPLDEKPKESADPHELARVRDILARPEVSLLVQRWDEDWSRLAWLRLRGQAKLLEPSEGPADDERHAAIDALRAKYPQYVDHDLASRPLIRIVVTDSVAWDADTTSS